MAERDALKEPQGLGGRLLTDSQIVERIVLEDEARRIVITPLINILEQLGPTSIDLHLGTEFIVMDRSSNTHFDPIWEEERVSRFGRTVHTTKRVDPLRFFVVHSKQFVVATTLEYVQLPRDIAGHLDGRSVWARHGVQVHCTASMIHPGSKGIIAFELQNMEDIPIKLYPGMRLGQLAFYQLDGVPIQAYDQMERAKFIGHINPRKGLYCDDFELRVLRELRRKRET
jgi:dCTP deaminase